MYVFLKHQSIRNKLHFDFQTVLSDFNYLFFLATYIFGLGVNYAHAFTWKSKIVQGNTS